MVQKIITILVGVALLCAIFFTLFQSFKKKDNIGIEKNIEIAQVTQIPEDKNVDPYKDYPVYDTPDLVFFWGSGCPHCQNVEDWVNQNSATDKLKINFKEVYNSDIGRTELFNTINQYCPELIASNGGIGVPVGFDPIKKKCIQGDTPIIDFLSSKLSK
jgi:hypothetical protein